MNRREFDFIIFPYRDSYFRLRYGSAVRDLQIVDALASNGRVGNIFLVNRPVSLYERVLGKRFAGPYTGFPKVNIIDTTSFDLFGPLTKRKWLSSCYRNIRTIPKKRGARVTVVLDFLPIGEIDYEAFGADYIWYDLIDNFRIHNRYDEVERGLVDQKYKYVTKYANLVTGVSKKAVQDFPNSMIVSNGAGLSIKSDQFMERQTPAYDFGFIGFITDKFDIAVIESISKLGYTILVAGEFYDKKVMNTLMKIKNVRLYGGFDQENIPVIVSQFRVGLIPYIKSKLHDESPLKLYQYLKYGRPVMTSVQYEIMSENIVCYGNMAPHEMAQAFGKLLERASMPGNVDVVRSTITKEHYWDYKIEKILGVIENHFEKEG